MTELRTKPRRQKSVAIFEKLGCLRIVARSALDRFLGEIITYSVSVSSFRRYVGDQSLGMVELDIRPEPPLDTKPSHPGAG